MKTETREIYKCDHCNKLYQIQGACEKHEVVCSKNPENDRKCFGCVHLRKRDVGVSYDTIDGEKIRKVSLLFCGKVDSFLYPPKVEHKKSWFEIGNDTNIPMKRECDMYNSEQ